MICSARDTLIGPLSLISCVKLMAAVRDDVEEIVFSTSPETISFPTVRTTAVGSKPSTRASIGLPKRLEDAGIQDAQDRRLTKPVDDADGAIGLIQPEERLVGHAQARSDDRTGHTAVSHERHTAPAMAGADLLSRGRSEEHTSELQS